MTENKVLGLNVTSAKYKELYKLQPKRKTENEVLFFELTIMNFIWKKKKLGSSSVTISPWEN